ncbi:MAG: phospho-sugar mutase, partial [Acidimicrobiia bacterium]|nr:phospho-sugar mutase [Acidimicrobiia bacterium]
PFPNPEEPGAMDLAIARAEETDADLVLANDPDADRLGVAVPSASGWVRLTGNQIGVLLIDHLLSRSDLPSHPPPLIVSTIVSSPLAERVAHAHGARFETTLTGFKWIMKAALDVESAGQGTFVFGFEEALGYAIGGLNRDKDGLSAALLMADLSSEARREGQTILDRLESIYRRHGLWVSVQNSIVRPGPEGAVEIESAMTYLGNHPPDSLGEKKVGSVTDYRKGADSRPAWLGAANLIALELPGGGRMLARPSGTEPKLKIYMDDTRPLAIADDPARIESVMVREAETAVSELVDHIGL